MSPASGVGWPVTVPAQSVDAESACEQRLVRRGEVLRAVIRTGAVALMTGVAYGFERWDGADWRDVDPFDGDPGAWAAVGLTIPSHTDWPHRVRVPERTAPGRHRITKWVEASHQGIGAVRLAAQFTVRDAPAVDYESLLSTGAWLGVRPGADRPTVRSLLGEPDEHGEGDCVWRYGDLILRFEADTLNGFFGQFVPDRLLDELTSREGVGVWTERFESGAQLDVERPHSGTFPRLRGFSVTR